MKKLPSPKVLNASRPFLSMASKLEIIVPRLKVELKQADMQIDEKKYIAYAVYSALNFTLITAVTLVLLGLIIDNTALAGIGFLSSPVIFAFMFFSVISRPKIVAKRKAREIDRELPYALRHLLIEVKSGIPLYQGLVTISDGYGAASTEFRTIVKEINAGRSQAEAIEESIVKNPSLSFRRVFWQILNAMKAGTEIEKTLESTVNDILREQLLAIKKYGQELNPYTMMYMMIGVIVPSLGITFLMILSTFTGLSLGAVTYAVIAVGLIIFQMAFINLVKTKRPMVRV